MDIVNKLIERIQWGNITQDEVLDTLEEVKNEYANLSGNVDLEDEIRDLNEEIESYESEIEDLNDEIDGLNNEIKDLEINLGKVEDKLNDLNEGLAGNR